MKFRFLILFLSVCLSSVALAKDLPYDENADAKAELAAAYQLAARDHKQLLITFGANWCKDCLAFDAATQRADIAQIIEQHFVMVKVDIGDWDKNSDVVAQYDNPIAKGIPSIVVADKQGKVLYATRGGQLATARSMGEQAFVEFFQALTQLSAK